jgi:hypothetical protein
MTITLKGSCLCNSVQYEVDGEPTGFYHCHCQRCRKASGTGHASNVLLKPGHLRWLKGEELVASFKVPDAKRFRNDFCTNCGANLPRAFKELDSVTIPAGTLDEPPPFAPKARIFMDSAADWSCQGDEIPAFDTYPGR